MFGSMGHWPSWPWAFTFQKLNFSIVVFGKGHITDHDRLNSQSHHPYSHLMGYSGCKRGGCFFICSDFSRWKKLHHYSEFSRQAPPWQGFVKVGFWWWVILRILSQPLADTPQFMHPHHHHHWLCHWFHAKGTFCEMEHYFNYWYHPLQGAGRTCNWNHCHFHHYYHSGLYWL